MEDLRKENNLKVILDINQEEWVTVEKNTKTVEHPSNFRGNTRNGFSVLPVELVPVDSEPVGEVLNTSRLKPISQNKNQNFVNQSHQRTKEETGPIVTGNHSPKTKMTIKN